MLRRAMRRSIVALAACLAPIAIAGTLARQPGAPPPIEVGALSGGDRDRAADAASLAATLYTSWLGPAPDAPPPIAAAAPLIDARGAMTIESDVAYRLAVAWFGERPASERARISGIAWYLQSRVVEKAFDLHFLRPGYRQQSLCFFGCHVRWSVPFLVTTRWADGIGRVEHQRASTGRDWPVVARPAVFPRDPAAIRTAIVLASLERELGWPALQGALRVVAADRAGAVVDTIEKATGRGLAKAFALPRSDVRILSAATAPQLECGPGPCSLMRVSIAEKDDVPFPLLVRFEFAREPAFDVWWSGTDDPIAVQTATPVTRVRLDPDRVWLLDDDFSDNDYHASPPPARPMLRWVARWVLWLQDATLMTTALL
jgi:hypothetical protein